jgi:hypothetical protein
MISEFPFFGNGHFWFSVVNGNGRYLISTRPMREHSPTENGEGKTTPGRNVLFSGDKIVKKRA